MEFHSFSAQFAPAIIDLWNRNVDPAFPMTKALFQQNTVEDENILHEGTAVVVDKGQVIAVVVSKIIKDAKKVPMQMDKGWIHLLLVDKAYRSQGIGTQLLQKAEHALQQAGMIKIQIGGDLLHYFCGIPEHDQTTQQFLVKHGYEPGQVMTDLTHTLKEQVELPTFEEIHFEPLAFEEKEAFLTFMHDAFPGRWEYEAIVYFEKGGTGKEFVVAKKGNDIIGFCRMNDVTGPTIAQNMNWSTAFEGNFGGIGPLGIEASARKGGYGLGITKAAVHFLQKRGVETILIDWTTIIEFYAKLGFTPWQNYHMYSKAL